jgi:hypothetical protein
MVCSKILVDGLDGISIAEAVSAEPVLVFVRQLRQHWFVALLVVRAIAMFKITHENVVAWLLVRARGAHGTRDFVDINAVGVISAFANPHLLLSQA